MDSGPEMMGVVSKELSQAQEDALSRLMDAFKISDEEPSPWPSCVVHATNEPDLSRRKLTVDFDCDWMMPSDTFRCLPVPVHVFDALASTAPNPTSSLSRAQQQMRNRKRSQEAMQQRRRWEESQQSGNFSEFMECVDALSLVSVCVDRPWFVSAPMFSPALAMMMTARPGTKKLKEERSQYDRCLQELAERRRENSTQAHQSLDDSELRKRFAEMVALNRSMQSHLCELMAAEVDRQKRGKARYVYWPQLNDTLSVAVFYRRMIELIKRTNCFTSLDAEVKTYHHYGALITAADALLQKECELIQSDFERNTYSLVSGELYYNKVFRAEPGSSWLLNAQQWPAMLSAHQARSLARLKHYCSNSSMRYIRALERWILTACGVDQSLQPLFMIKRSLPMPHWESVSKDVALRCFSNNRIVLSLRRANSPDFWQAYPSSASLMDWKHSAYAKRFSIRKASSTAAMLKMWGAEQGETLARKLSANIRGMVGQLNQGEQQGSNGIVLGRRFLCIVLEAFCRHVKRKNYHSMCEVEDIYAALSQGQRHYEAFGMPMLMPRDDPPDLIKMLDCESEQRVDVFVTNK